MWHDHSRIGGHSHLLVLVATVYDPALYFTTEEMQQKGANIDVPTVVEELQVHILCRSTSSLDDQTQLIECRRECLVYMDKVLCTQAVYQSTTMCSSFTEMAQQRNLRLATKLGDHYSCVGCEAHSSRFDDLAYCFCAHRPTLTERQDFILQEAWKHSRINPLDKLRVAELGTELEKRGVNTRGTKKPQLEQELEKLQKGISNVPAILQITPQATLDSVKLGKYEIYPTEPLHDLKGHMRYIVDEVAKKQQVKPSKS